MNIYIHILLMRVLILWESTDCQSILATACDMLMPHAGNMEDKVIFLHEVEDMDVELNLFIKPCPFTNSLYLSPPRGYSLWQRKPFLHSSDIGKSRQQCCFQ